MSIFLKFKSRTQRSTNKYSSPIPKAALERSILNISILSNCFLLLWNKNRILKKLKVKEVKTKTRVKGSTTQLRKSPTKLQFNFNVILETMPFVDHNETTTHYLLEKGSTSQCMKATKLNSRWGDTHRRLCIKDIGNSWRLAHCDL